MRRTLNLTTFKHLRDARGVVVSQWGTLDLEAIRRGTGTAGMLEELEAIVEAARHEIEENT